MAKNETPQRYTIGQAVANGHIVSWHQNWISQSGEFLPRVNAIGIEERIYQQARALLASGEE